MLRVLLLCVSALVFALQGHLLLQGRPLPALLPARLFSTPALHPGCAPLGLAPHVLVYNRLEKTGSSTLLSVIDALAARNNFSHVRLPQLYNASAARGAIGAALLRPQRTLLSEHFAFPELEDDRVAYVQVVRDPVARCVSWYHWSRYSHDNPWTASNRRAFGTAALDECVAGPPAAPPGCLNCPPLHQAQAFCGANGGPCFDGSLGSPEVLRRAARTVEASYPVVGLTERLEASLALLEGAFPQFFAGALAVLRRPGFASARVFRGTAGYPRPSNGTKALLAQHLRGEQQLYAQLEARLAAQLACLPGGGAV